ncbi:5-carboxymethyl-2-hydroxymuconate Delta-isomerase [Thalassospira sp. TSL5-1]|uniref:5-carboxymethyl-2-hydroxymuconate Delta-isomerase n=1 Tax=Thalassospira sp. TSL5-1 TaxID=1544451 RepID=UPI00093CDD58|nr:5-carboxymethyl-2-hydroxymuconate isomerase [Thalassospira sp. TSL5-1]OKH86575.1 5-carboxymethyl-2-hydroxymuconate isomerase [Thalassospira sp. TSL5-1]
MPQIEIEYSADLPVADALPDLALAIHRALAPIADTEIANFKTRLSPLSGLLIGDGTAQNAMVHVDVRLLSGRTDAVKQAVGQKVQELLLAHLKDRVGGFSVQFTTEIHDLDRANYHKAVV